MRLKDVLEACGATLELGAERHVCFRGPTGGFGEGKGMSLS